MDHFDEYQNLAIYILHPILYDDDSEGWSSDFPDLLKTQKVSDSIAAYRRSKFNVQRSCNYVKELQANGLNDEDRELQEARAAVLHSKCRSIIRNCAKQLIRGNITWDEETSDYKLQKEKIGKKDYSSCEFDNYIAGFLVEHGISDANSLAYVTDLIIKEQAGNDNIIELIGQGEQARGGRLRTSSRRRRSRRGSGRRRRSGRGSGRRRSSQRSGRGSGRRRSSRRQRPTQAKPRAKTKPGAKPGAKGKPRAKAEAKAKPEAKAEAKTKPRAKPEAKAKPKAEADGMRQEEEMEEEESLRTRAGRAARRAGSAAGRAAGRAVVGAFSGGDRPPAEDRTVSFGEGGRLEGAAAGLRDRFGGLGAGVGPVDGGGGFGVGGDGGFRDGGGFGGRRRDTSFPSRGFSELDGEDEIRRSIRRESRELERLDAIPRSGSGFRGTGEQDIYTKNYSSLYADPVFVRRRRDAVRWLRNKYCRIPQFAPKNRRAVLPGAIARRDVPPGII